MTHLELAKAIAIHLGVVGRVGGWLYMKDKPVCQGWFEWTQRCEKKKWIVDRGPPFDPHVDWRKITEEVSQ